jgi:hypothetical protein
VTFTVYFFASHSSILKRNVSKVLTARKKRLPAYRLMYTHPQEGDPNIRWKHLRIGTIVKDKVFYIDYSNPGFFPAQFDLDLPTIQKMISSLRLKHSLLILVAAIMAITKGFTVQSMIYLV